MNDDETLSKFVTHLLVDAGADVESTTFSSLPTSSSFTRLFSTSCVDDEGAGSVGAVGGTGIGGKFATTIWY